MSEFLSPGELIKISSTISSNREKAFLLLLLETGISLSELTNLKPKNFHTTNKNNILTLIIKKNKKKLAIPLSKELSKLLLDDIRKIRQNDFIFQTRESSRISNRRVEQILKNLGDRAGVKLSPRIIKNTFVFNSLMNETNIGFLKELLGETSVKNYLYKFFNYKNELRKREYQSLNQRHPILNNTSNNLSPAMINMREVRK